MPGFFPVITSFRRGTGGLSRRGSLSSQAAGDRKDFSGSVRPPAIPGIVLMIPHKSSDVNREFEPNFGGRRERAASAAAQPQPPKTETRRSMIFTGIRHRTSTASRGRPFRPGQRHLLSSRTARRAKKRQDGRHGGRLFPILGVCAKQKLRKAKKRHGWPAWMPAVTIPLGFSRSENPRPKNGTEAVALGRHGGRLFPLPGVLQSKTPGPKMARMADRMSAVTNSWSFCEAKTPKGEKTAWMPFFRPRKGEEGRVAPGPER
jgi:hypothetical protein